MVDVAQYINEVKRDSDTLQIINDIQVQNNNDDKIILLIIHYNLFIDYPEKYNRLECSQDVATETLWPFNF